MKKDHHIRFFIFESQRRFVEHIFGRWEPGITSIGMAKADEQLVLITSFIDESSGRDLEEYLKVVRHELIHILSPHEKAWLNEGLALFLAGQERDIVEYPEHIEQLELFMEANIYSPEAYGYYSWLTRYIIGRSGFEAYLDFFRSIDSWALIGYPDQGAFCDEAFRVLRNMQQGE